jgi:hypothetical protein
VMKGGYIVWNTSFIENFKSSPRSGKSYVHTVEIHSIFRKRVQGYQYTLQDAV